MKAKIHVLFAQLLLQMSQKSKIAMTLIWDITDDNMIEVLIFVFGTHDVPKCVSEVKVQIISGVDTVAAVLTHSSIE